MQNIGEQQFLVLLLVIEPDLDDRNEFGEIGRGFDQLRHRAIDMRAISGDLGRARPRHQAALRPRGARAGRDVIRVVQIGEALIERAIIFDIGLEQKLLEKPGDVGAMPLGRARIGHRLDDLIFRRQQSGAALGFGAHGAKGVEPMLPRIGARRFRDAIVGRGNGTNRISEPKALGKGGDWHGSMSAKGGIH